MNLPGDSFPFPWHGCIAHLIQLTTNKAFKGAPGSSDEGETTTLNAAEEDLQPREEDSEHAVPAMPVAVSIVGSNTKKKTKKVKTVAAVGR